MRRRKVVDDLGARDAAYNDFDRGGIGDENARFAFRAGWERAGRLADARDTRIDELEQALAAVQALLPGERTFAESLARDHDGNLFPRLIDTDAVAAALVPAGDILAREQAAGAHEALDTVARELAQPGVLWYGDKGVTVDDGTDPDQRTAPGLVDWLMNRADQYRQKAVTSRANISVDTQHVETAVTE